MSNNVSPVAGPIPPGPGTPPGKILPNLQSTPVKIELSTTCPFTTNQKYRNESHTTMGKEIKKYLVGPMPVQEFLDDFFPVGQLSGLDGVPSFTPDCYRDTVSAKKETKSYQHFVQSTQEFAPLLRIVNTSSNNDCNPRSDFPFDIKPDVSVYRADSQPNVKTDSSLAELFIEFKWNPSDNPFCDVYQTPFSTIEKPQTSFLHETKGAIDTLGQITAYAAAHLGSQFRTHIYSILIVKDTARILRWDRSGTIVTEAILYNESPALAEFFRRFSTASPEMRGVDQSVSSPTPSEALSARQALGLEATVPLVKLEIPGPDGSPHYFVTATPRATPYTPPGRATRGFPAYYVAQNTLVFLKDSWRVDLPDIQAEGLTYQTLREGGVRNVPHCLVSGDISTTKYHATKTWSYRAKLWACHSGAHFIPHRHYRLVLDVIGRPLMAFESSYEMVTAVRDSLVALQDAYKAGILHRDFSPGNVVIGVDGRGWLIDWDLSKPLSLTTASETPRRATRTGTWQFMSANLIGDMDGKQDLKDDLESSVYILLWVALTYSECSDSNQVPLFMEGVLDPQPHGSTGGYGKADFLKGRTFLERVHFPRRPALHRLISQLATLFAVRYETRPTNQDRALAKALQQLPNLYQSSTAYLYDQRMAALETHEATIKFFNDALNNRSEWPANDRAVKQYMRKTERPSGPVIKTSWNTELFMQAIYGDDEWEEEDVEMSEISSEMTDSTIRISNPSVPIWDLGPA